MMRQSIEKLMESVGCEKWPERWREIYDQAMDDFDQSGCLLTDSGYYDALAEKYQVLQGELDTYKQAAIEVGQDENLARLLHLLYIALAQEEFNTADTAAFKLPCAPTETLQLGRDMLTGLAVCSQLPRCAERLRAKNIPEDVIRDVLRLPEKGLTTYRAHNGGVAGYDLLDWYQLAIAGKLFPMGRLEMELYGSFLGNACVFRNDRGESIALAHGLSVHRDGVALGAGKYEDAEGSWEANVLETETAWEGYPFGEDGLVQKKTVRLNKSQWQKVMSKGDAVVQLHIPGSGKLSEEAVSESIERMRTFLETYYPEFQYKAFSCASWLLNPKVADLVGEDSNIVRFGKRFQRLTWKIHGMGVFYFVFMQPSNDCNIENLQANTRLEKALKQYYLDGNRVHEMVGYFF